MTLVLSLVTRQRPVQKTTLLSQARLSSLMPSTVTPLPTTRLRQSRATVLLLSTPSLDRNANNGSLELMVGNPSTLIVAKRFLW